VILSRLIPPKIILFGGKKRLVGSEEGCFGNKTEVIGRLDYGLVRQISTGG
jgi:hypothetical protein